mmetsp:Transcript_6917/g.9565  ORF Transcript_6917/g.9565 Transcript_6917/m.9565 type:complete len:313 (-) Transcript_6917:22-960(-)
MNYLPTGAKFRIDEIPFRKSLPCAYSCVIDINRATAYYMTGDKNLYKSHINDGFTKINTEPWKVTGGLTFDGGDWLYFASQDVILRYHIPTQIVSIFKQDFVLKRLVTSPANSFVKGLAVDTKGDVYALIDDGIYHLWESKGKVERKRIASRTYNKAVLYTPQAESMMISQDGIIYYTDRDANCIRIFHEGKFDQIAIGDLYAPRSFVMDNDGNLLVVDWSGIKHINVKTNKCSNVPAPAASNVRCVAKDAKGKIWFGGYSISQAEPLWYWQRFLWIGKLKEDPSCCALARLPKELIQEIARCMHSLPKIPT